MLGSVRTPVYDLFNPMITIFMDNRELSDSDFCEIAPLHKDTAAIIGTLHRSIVSAWLYGDYCGTGQYSQYRLY